MFYIAHYDYIHQTKTKTKNLHTLDACAKFDLLSTKLEATRPDDHTAVIRKGKTLQHVYVLVEA